MAGKDVQMEEAGGAEEDLPQEDAVDSSVGTDGKTKKNQKSQRRRLTGGGGILRNLTRRNSIGASLNEHFDLSELSEMEGKKLILKCQVKLTINLQTRNRVLFLYDDTLIIAKPKNPPNFHVKNRIDLRDIWVSEEETGQRSDVAEANGPIRSEKFVVGWPIVNAEVEFPTVDEKDLCVTKLQELMTAVREKEPQHAIVRMEQNDTKYTVTKRIMVGNYETAQMVLSRCIKEFHIVTESPKYFQLCAVMSRNDLPIPLTGQEVLYRIQMKYRRDHPETDRDTSADTEAVTEPPIDELLFQLITSEKKSLVLKRSLANDDLKPAKRTSPFARFFRMPSKMADEGRLYHRPLSELCKDGKLCCRLMMMLSHLFVNGPKFEEIFRKPPALKEHRIQQDRLDRRKDFNFDEVNACEMSQLLKSFLSALPECLLTNELYNEWAEVPKQPEKRTKIAHAKSLVDRLPDCNRLFLRHLICVLHHIASFSHVNFMPPKSLSICIGQCLLWLPPTKIQPNNNDDITNEVHRLGVANSVAEVLIEHAHEIFGTETLRLFNHLSSSPPIAITNSLRLNHSAVSASLECENRNSHSGVVRDVAYSDRGGIFRSNSCFNYPTMSLTKEANGNKMQDFPGDNKNAIKRDSSWHVSQTNYATKDDNMPEELDLNLSHSSSQIFQMDLFPEQQSATGAEECASDRNRCTESSVIFDEQMRIPDPAKPDGVAVSVDDSNSEPRSLTKDSRTTNGVYRNSIARDENIPEQGHSDNTQTVRSDKIEFRIEEVTDDFSHVPLSQNNDPISNQSDDSLIADSSVSTKSRSIDFSDSANTPGLIFVFPETSGDVDSPMSRDFECDLPSSTICTSPHENSSEQELASEINATPSTSLSLAKPASTRTKPTALVLPSQKHALLYEHDEVKSPATSATPSRSCRASVGETTTINSRPALSSTPDDGYYSPSNTESSAISPKSFGLPPKNSVHSSSSVKSNKQNGHELERNNFKSNISDVGLQTKSPERFSSPFLRRDTETAPQGMVRRLKSEITTRELSHSKPLPTELTPTCKSANPSERSSASNRSTLCGDSILQRSKSNDPPYTPVVAGLTSTDHSQVQHSKIVSRLSNEFSTKCPPIGEVSVRANHQNLQKQNSNIETSRCSGVKNNTRCGEQLACSTASFNATDRSLRSYSDQRPETSKEAPASNPRGSELVKPNCDIPIQSTGESRRATFTSFTKCPTKSTGYPSVSRRSAEISNCVNTAIDRQISPSDDLPPKEPFAGKSAFKGASLHVGPSRKNPALACVDQSSDSDDFSETVVKRYPHTSDRRTVTCSSSQPGVERSISDAFEISPTPTPNDDKPNSENKENLSRNQQLKRLSVTRQSSTPEKVSKILVQQPSAVNQEVDDASDKPPRQTSSMKHKDWHKELTEQFKLPTATPVSCTSPIPGKPGTKKPTPRSAHLGPTLSFTPMPLLNYHGNMSHMSKTADKSRKA